VVSAVAEVWHLLQNRVSSAPTRGIGELDFRCDDVYATAEALKSRGVKLAAEPKKEIWGTMAKFRDPDGNEFVFSSK